MARSPEDIANEIKQAVVVIAKTNAQVASAVTGKSIAEGIPTIEVRLNDGRTVELGALADELLAALAG